MKTFMGFHLFYNSISLYIPAFGLAPWSEP